MSVFSALGGIAGAAIGSFFNAPQLGGAIGSAAGSFFDSSPSSGGGSNAGVRATLASGAATRSLLRKQDYLSKSSALLDKTTASAKARQNKITNKGGTGYSAPNAIGSTKSVKAATAENINASTAKVYLETAQKMDSSDNDFSKDAFNRQMKKFIRDSQSPGTIAV